MAQLSLPATMLDIPIASACSNYSFPDVVCIQRYGSVMAPGFYRAVQDIIGDADTYASTMDPGDPSFKSVANSSFIVWDEQQASSILGPAPTLDYMFTITEDMHEAPVYAPNTNELYFSRLANSYLPQLVVNLTTDPPTLSEKLADPPIYAPSGGRYWNGSIIFSAGGQNQSLGEQSFVPGLYQLDPVTGKSRVLLNNYFGYYFSMCDDMDIDANGNIWFTDPCESPLLSVLVCCFSID
jgi:hypothetical protein